MYNDSTEMTAAETMGVEKFNSKRGIEEYNFKKVDVTRGLSK